ncbi:MAG: tetratricopeptide repeat protein, partial [Bacteroidota bacterium]
FLKKIYLFWSHIEIANNLSYYWFERSSFVLKILPVGFWLVGPLGFAGAVLAWKSPRARLLLLLLVLYCLVTSTFFVGDRFRLPIVPVLCIFAGYAVHHSVVSVTSRGWRALANTTALVGAGVLLVNTNFAQLHPDDRFGEEEMKGRAALESGDLTKAVELLERAANLDPGNSSVRINQGIALWRMGRTKEAAEALRAGIRGNPYLATLNLAHLYFNIQQMDSAWVYAERAVQARPFAPGGYIIAAKTLLVQQNVRRAEETLLAGLVACGDDFVYAEYLLAGLYFQNGNLASADSIYRRVLARTVQSKQPEYSVGSEKEQLGEDLPTLHAKTLHALGRAFAAHGRLDSSEVYLRAAAHLLPMKSDVWADWGVCLLRMNRLEEADTVMRRVIRIDPANTAVWFNYATLLARKGEFGTAKQAVAQALVLRPDFEEAQRLLHALVTREKQDAGKK